MSYNPLRIFRRDADVANVADGQPSELATNSIGRLKVSAIPGALDATTGTLTAVAQTVVCEVARASNVMVQITGTFAGLNAAFEVSLDGGVTWIGTQAVRTNANTIETATGVIASNPIYGWELSVNACTHVRLRATAFTSGVPTVRILPGSYATEPIPAIQTHPITGTVTMTSTTIAAPAATIAGATVTPINSAASTNLTALKAAANGRLLGVQVANNGATWAYFKLYNKVSAPVLATDTPIAILAIPPNGVASFPTTIPGTFAAGIAYAITGGAATADATNVAANQVTGFTLHV